MLDFYSLNDHNIILNTMNCRLLLLAIILLSFITLTHSACSSNCYSCVNPNSGSGRFRCTSCNSNMFLFSQRCYDCIQCDSFGSCSQCPSTQSTSDAINIYAVIFGVLAGITAICIIVIVVYYKCFKLNPAVPPIGRREVAYASNIQLLDIPSDMKWTKGESKVNFNQNCAICLDNGVYLMTHCNHLYHPKCIWEWISKKQLTCPLCKGSELDPIKIYCLKCAQSYIELKLNTVPNFLQQAKWKQCDSCQTGTL